eukprot:c6565_g1_i2.p1 GENE.c6565_g1_i2~~c6565_g1_i2.p1  ORF type:complete len:209 (+),score=66.21 c6565_g1_i2:183-809(+)
MHTHSDTHTVTHIHHNTTTGECIVNSVNRGCQYGGSVDSAVVAKAGPELAVARDALQLQPSCQPGDARITVGGNLPSKWCIHAVGPNFNFVESEAEGDKTLFIAYRKCLALAEEKQVTTLGFSVLSSGSFSGARNMKSILLVGLYAIATHEFHSLKEIHLVCFKDKIVNLMLEASKELFCASGTPHFRTVLARHNLEHLLNQEADSKN